MDCRSSPETSSIIKGTWQKIFENFPYLLILSLVEFHFHFRLEIVALSGGMNAHCSLEVTSSIDEWAMKRPEIFSEIVLKER